MALSAGFCYWIWENREKMSPRCKCCKGPDQSGPGVRYVNMCIPSRSPLPSRKEEVAIGTRNSINSRVKVEKVV